MSLSNFNRTLLSPFLSRHLLLVKVLGLTKVWVIDYKGIRIEDLDYEQALNRMFNASRLFNITPLEVLAEHILSVSNIYIVYKRKPIPTIIRL